MSFNYDKKYQSHPHVINVIKLLSLVESSEKRDQLSTSTARAIEKVWKTNLSLSKLPKSTDLAPADEVAVLLSILSIKLLNVSCIFPDICTTIDIDAAAIWPGVWKWIQVYEELFWKLDDPSFLNSLDMRKSPLPFNALQDSTELIGTLTRPHTKQLSRVRAAIMATDGVVSMIVRQWTFKYHSHSVRRRYTSLHPQLMLYLLQAEPYSTTEQICLSLDSGRCDGADVFAVAWMRHLRESINMINDSDATTHLGNSIAQALIAMSQHFSCNNRLFFAVHDRGALDLVMRSLQNIIANRRLRMEMPHTTNASISYLQANYRCLSAATNVTRRLLTSLSGSRAIPCLSAAIREGLLYMFLETSVALSQLDFEVGMVERLQISECWTLDEWFPTVLVFRSSLRYLPSALKDPRIEKLRNSTQSNPIWKSWDIFEAIATSRLLLKNYIKTRQATKSYCTYPDCTQKKRIRDYKRCSGCKISLYCSQFCQKRDLDRHQTKCGPEATPLSAEYLGTHDRAFIIEIIQSEFLYLWEDVKQLALERTTNLEDSKACKIITAKKVFLEMDFSSYPVTISLLPLSTLRISEDQDKLLSELRNAKFCRILVQAIIPGEQFVFTGLKLPPSLFGAQVLVPNHNASMLKIRDLVRSDHSSTYKIPHGVAQAGKNGGDSEPDTGNESSGDSESSVAAHSHSEPR